MPNEYQTIKHELGTVQFALIKKYLEQHKDVTLAEVYYTPDAWAKFDTWTRERDKATV